MMEYPPSCDNVGIPPSKYNYTDTGRFEQFCEHKHQYLNETWYKLAQNPCDCRTYLYCETQKLGNCAAETPFFNPCTGGCEETYPTAKACPDFCGCFDGTKWIQGKEENCARNLITTTTTTTTIRPTTTIISTTASPTTGNKGLALGLGIGIPLLLLVLIVAFCLWRKRQWAKNPDRFPTPWYQALMILPCLPCRVLRTKLLTEHNNRSEDNVNFYKKGYSTKLVYNVSEKTDNSFKFDRRMKPPTAPPRRQISGIYKNAQQFPLELIDVGKTLGRGAYGKVFKGRIFLNPDLGVEVAIKTCTRSTGSEDIEREARVFLKLKERHMNIVNLLGVCIPSENEINPMLLLELCEGNLEKHLHRNCDKFKEGGDKTSKVLNSSGEFSSRSLLKFCYQVSRGLEFLEKNKIVHGDLATRNILLANDKTIAKVSDFGLSRSLYQSVEELDNASSGLPVRWMAPEVLTMRQVTNKSDIWSFGVLMWEIFSLGAVPYPEVSQIDVQFIKDLSNGVRSLGDALYEVSRVQDMIDDVRVSTLQLRQELRPSFMELSPQLWKVLSEASKDDYKKLEREYVRYISLINASYEQLVNSNRQTTSL